MTIEKDTAFDSSLSGVGFTTVMVAVPMAAISAAAIVALNSVLDTNAVVRSVLVHITTEPAMKFVPITVRVKVGPPASAVAGLMLVIVGTEGVALAGM